MDWSKGYNFGGGEHNMLNDSIVEEEMEYNAATKSILFLFVVLAIGCFVKQVLKRYDLPYTVVLFILAAMFSGATNKFSEINSFQDVTRIPANILMQMFLPILIFESAFTMDSHFFIRSLLPCLLLAIPGLIICSTFTAVYSSIVLSKYNWDWKTCFLFGCILSATDPVAVVALLKEVGISPALTTLIEGESLLNDGVAIVIFEVLFDSLKEVSNEELSTSTFMFTFAKVGLGAPVFGYGMGLVTSWILLHINNDAVLEFTVTLCSSFLSYYIAEELLHLSGVLAVVVLGVIVSMNKSSFSPESEEAVHSFWEMMGYFANTLIFSIVGIIISQQALLNMVLSDVFLALATYVAVTVFRFIMVLMFSPLLKRMAYGLPWKHGVVLIWGGLRGAVGLALALILSEEHAMNTMASNQILIQLSMIIVLTLVVNGVTMKYLLQMLGLKMIPQSRQVAMAHAVEHLRGVAAKSIKIHKRDKFLSDSNWLWIKKHTHIVDPYNATDEFDINCQYTPYKSTQCPKCHENNAVTPSDEEMKEMSEETRLHVLKALKVCYWKYFDHGLMCSDTVNILNSVANETIDQPERYIDAKKLIDKYMKIPFMLQGLVDCLINFGDKLGAESFRGVDENTVKLYNETTGIRHWCLKLVASTYWEPIILLIIVTNVVPVILEALEINIVKISNHYCIIYLTFATIFLLLFTAETVIKIIGLGWKCYIENDYNKFAFFLVIFGSVNIALDAINDNVYEFISPQVIPALRLIWLFRLIELYRIFWGLLARLVKWLKNKASLRQYLAYDLGRGYQVAQHETMEKIHYVVDYEPCAIIPLREAEQGNALMMEELTKLQSKNRGVVIARKSHIAAVSVLNDLNLALKELHEDGLLEDVETARLKSAIYDLKLKIQHAAKFLADSPSAAEILKKAEWVTDERLYNFVKDHYVVKDYKAQQIINEIGKLGNRISIITSGVVKITGKSSTIKLNSIPNTDSFLYFTNKGSFFEYVTTGYSLGLIGSLQNSEFVTTAVCVTDVQVLHISMVSFYKAVAQISEKPSLSYIIWRYISLRIASSILLEQPRYNGCTGKELQLKLESCVIPDFKTAMEFTIDDLVEGMVLIQGQVRDPVVGKLYVGPCYIPNTVRHMLFADQPDLRARVIMVIIAGKNYCVPDVYDWSGQDSTSSKAQKSALERIVENSKDDDESSKGSRGSPIRKRRSTKRSISISSGDRQKTRRKSGSKPKLSSGSEEEDSDD